MLDAMEKWLKKYRMLEPGDKVLLACSGGPDSLALVHGMHKMQAEGLIHVSLAVAHVNHMLRPEAAAEAEFVREFCRRLGLECYSTAVDAPAYMAASGESLEAAARRLRYEYLFQVADDWGGAKIATGHHRDDQAETVLIHLLRGAGGAGLRGMLPVNGRLLRPLLGIGRPVIDGYCREQGLTPCCDASNFNTDFLRNRIRLELLPALEEKYNPRIREALCRTAGLLRDDYEFIRDQARSYLDKLTSEQNDALTLDGPGFAKLPVALRRELIRQIIEKKSGKLTGISFVHVERMLEMISNAATGSLFFLPGGLRVCKTYAGLEMSPSGAGARREKAPPNLLRAQVLLTIPGATWIPELNLTVAARLLPAAPADSSPNSAVFDPESLELPLYVRNRLPGDRFAPLGMTGTKKLKDFFIDAKVPQTERDRVPIICDQGGIIWVGGFRQSRRGGVSGHTRKFLRMDLNFPG